MNSGTLEFLKALETFRAHKAIFVYLYLKNREVYRPETLYEGNLIRFEILLWLSGC